MMHSKTIQKILEDEDTFDLMKAAEAILTDEKRREKRERVRSKGHSNAAYGRIKHREQEEEAWRQRLAEAWKKTHPSP